MVEASRTRTDSGPSLLLSEYRAARERFFARRGAQFPDTLADPYDLLDVFPLPRSEVTAILEAARAAGSVYRRAAALIRSLRDESLLEMGLPATALGAARMAVPGMPDTVWGRFDFARSDDGYKLLEFNADAPGFLVETFSVNARVCRDAGLVDPNAGGEAALAAALLDALHAGADSVGRGSGARVAFASCGHCRRDVAMARYLMTLLTGGNGLRADYFPLTSLRADASGLYDPAGDRIDVLCRIYPLHLFRGPLFEPHSLSGGAGAEESGTLIFDLAVSRRLALVNPPSAILLASKAVQALIWGLFEAGLVFSAEERDTIRRFFLPTCLDPPESGLPYVVKPAFGSEGSGVSLVDRRSGTTRRGSSAAWTEEPLVYQRYVEIPTRELMTEHGPRTLHLLFSCFLIAGEPMGICLRAGELITDESAWVVPLCVAGERADRTLS